jgi:hypothetical protein
VHVFKDGTSVRPSVAVGPSDATGPLHFGEARLRFRPTHFPDRRLFFLDAVFTPHPSAPAFSGFFVRGRIDDLPSGVVAQFSTWSVKRNDPTWRSWL